MRAQTCLNIEDGTKIAKHTYTVGVQTYVETEGSRRNRKRYRHGGRAKHTRKPKDHVAIAKHTVTVAIWEKNDGFVEARARFWQGAPPNPPRPGTNFLD